MALTPGEVDFVDIIARRWPTVTNERTLQLIRVSSWEDGLQRVCPCCAPGHSSPLALDTPSASYPSPLPQIGIDIATGIQRPSKKTMSKLLERDPHGRFELHGRGSTVCATLLSAPRAA